MATFREYEAKQDKMKFSVEMRGKASQVTEGRSRGWMSERDRDVRELEHAVVTHSGGGPWK